GPVLRFFGRGREVGRDDDVVELEQRAGVRLRGEDVECGAADLAALESFEERVLVDQLATCSVYDPDTVPHLRERVRSDRAARVVGQRQVERQEVGGCEDVVDSLDPLYSE